MPHSTEDEHAETYGFLSEVLERAYESSPTPTRPLRHAHTFQGQRLVHAHEHDAPHGYFEHPEDGVRVVRAEFTRRATIITPDTSGIVTDTPGVRAAVEALTEARTRLRGAVQQAEDSAVLSRRARYNAWQRVEESERDRDYARGDVERAVRAANPGAAEAAIQAAARAL